MGVSPQLRGIPPKSPLQSPAIHSLPPFPQRSLGITTALKSAVPVPAEMPRGSWWCPTSADEVVDHGGSLRKVEFRNG